MNSRYSPAARGARWLVVALVAAIASGHAAEPSRWTQERAQAWAQATPCLAGCNFIPSNAVNALEMWQAPTFDEVTLDRELRWAHELGFNAMRVFLHNLAWRDDPAGFLTRVDRFLAIAARHQIRIMFVFFDACWDPNPWAGPQPAPQPHRHNSGWVQSPAYEQLINPGAYGELEAYVKTVLQRFGQDERVVVWDLYNEADNPGRQPETDAPQKEAHARMLLTQAFAWTRQVGPAQPATSGLWRGDFAAPPAGSMNEVILQNSDVISFHTYGGLEGTRRTVETLKHYGRPLLCTEYLARPLGNRLETHLAYFREERIGAFNWGFVSGKTQTIYPWDSWEKPYTEEPAEWFHDILRPDGEPFRRSEADFLKRLLRDQSP